MTTRQACLILILAIWLAGPGSAHGQFLRIGPFDFTAQSRLEGVYTTNVEGQRKAEATKSREDYYIVAGLDLNSTAVMVPKTTVNLDTGISMEKHFIREDLDNSSFPFGRAQASAATEVGRYRLNAEVGYARTFEEEDSFTPQGQPQSQRKEQTTLNYLAGVVWTREPFGLGANYSHTRDRFPDEQFQSGDSDEDTINYMASWRLLENVGLRYNNERTRTILVNSEDTGGSNDEEDWQVTETITVDWRLLILKRPQLTYSFGLEKQDTGEEKGKWDPVHTFSLSDQWAISPTLNLSLNASYNEDPSPDSEKDVAFTYGGALNHAITPTATEALRFTRQPVNTFGSTADTAQDTYSYDFTKNDLFIYNLTLRLGVVYAIDDPLSEEDGATEKTWTYTGELSHSRELTRKLSRTMKYVYTQEDSNFFSELLTEHRVTLSYNYTF